MDEGHVLVMACGADESRLALLMDAISASGLTVVRGPDIGGQPAWAQEADAAALLVPNAGKPWPDPQSYPLLRFAREGQLVFANLDTTPHPAPQTGDAAYVDLAGWSGGPSPELDGLIAQLRELLAVPRGGEFSYELSANQVGYVSSGIAELQSLTDDLGQIGEVLSDDEERSQALRATLAEISGTYRVVKSAIEQFAAAGASPGGPDVKAYAALAHGPLAQQIRNGRGHCRRIGLRYMRVGGLRDGLKGKLAGNVLANLDRTFDRLANADGDVFSAMDALGHALTNESQIILRHLRTGRLEHARQHIDDADEQLQGLEKALDAAIAAFQDVATTLGYAEPVAKPQEIHTMTTMNFYGDVNQSNIVVAQTIENSRIAVQSSSVPEDLKAALLGLHEATTTLAKRLAPDDAALAAKDLEDLSKEATSPAPRLPVLRRAAVGLLAAAKSVAEGGAAVIDLVGKVGTLLGFSIGV